MADSSKVGSNPSGDKPAGARDTGEGVAFPTSDLPGTDHPNPPATDQQGVKGMDPSSETGTRSESEPGGKER